MTRHFLDTTAHVERWMGAHEQQHHVRAALAGETHATSSHARREWRYIVEGATVDILNALRRGSGTLGQVFASLSQGWGRSTGHRLRVLSLITASETAVDREMMELRAQALIRYQSEMLFTAAIDIVRDGSDCGLARNVVRQKSNGDWEYVNTATGSERCKKTDAICLQDDDLGNKTAALADAADALAGSTDAAHRAMAKAAVKAVVDPPSRKGKACYGLLGDVSLALEVEPGETVLTTDRSFEVMAPSLGLTVDRFAATPPP